jgi:ParB family chromosome partitioning protein
MTISHVPLDKLQLSPRNARKTGAADLEALAASIHAHGLLQNLNITEGATGFEVVAGGRRLAALRLLVDRGAIAADFAVPVRVIADDSAFEASTAENVVREQMHPADQFDAFRAMVDAGKPIEDVAAHFGVGIVVVQRRLKLSLVAPEIIAEFRAGKASLDQLMALAITEDHAAQRRAWFDAEPWDKNARQIREVLTLKEVCSTDKRARLVGVEAYERAGGVVRRDLFSENGTCYLLDEQLLDHLVVQRLEDEAEALKREGWSFAKIIDKDAWRFTQSCAHSPTKAEKPTLDEFQQKRLDALRARRDALNDELSALDDQEIDIDEDDARVIEIAQIDDQIEGLSLPKETFTDRQKAKAGCVLTWDHNGSLQIIRGLIPQTEKAQEQAAITGATPAKKKAPELSQDMKMRLELHRATAAREHIAGHPAIALRMLLAHLVASLLTHSHDATSAFNITPTSEQNADESKFVDVKASRAAMALRERIEELRQSKGLPKRASDVHVWLGKQTIEEGLELLALLIALTLTHHAGNAAADLFAIDMAQWWEPTPETFLTLVPKALLAQAVTEVAGKSAGEAIAAMKKDAAIAKTAEHLAGTGWLPKPLRGSGYALRKGAREKSSKGGLKPSPKPKKKTTKNAAVKKMAAPKKAPKKATGLAHIVPAISP